MKVEYSSRGRMMRGRMMRGRRRNGQTSECHHHDHDRVSLFFSVFGLRVAESCVTNTFIRVVWDGRLIKSHERRRRKAREENK